jgi:hypothetical protein
MCLNSDIVFIDEQRCSLATKFTAGPVDNGSKFTTAIFDGNFSAGVTATNVTTDLIVNGDKFAAGNVNIGGAP